jgi:hypothetical protein
MGIKVNLANRKHLQFYCITRLKHIFVFVETVYFSPIPGFGFCPETLKHPNLGAAGVCLRSCCGVVVLIGGGLKKGAFSGCDGKFQPMCFVWGDVPFCTHWDVKTDVSTSDVTEKSLHTVRTFHLNIVSTNIV